MKASILKFLSEALIPLPWKRPKVDPIFTFERLEGDRLAQAKELVSREMATLKADPALIVLRAGQCAEHQPSWCVDIRSKAGLQTHYCSYCQGDRYFVVGDPVTKDGRPYKNQRPRLRRNAL
jgi:hypothetical protein